MPDGVTDGDGWIPLGRTYVSSYVEGTLYIDLIDAKKKELIWKGRYWLPLKIERKRKNQ
jgi:hypothetical protein